MEIYKFSLIIPTLGREKELIQCLQSMKHLKYKNFEVLIIDQNKINFIKPIYDKFKKDFKLQHIRVDYTGAARARNDGFQKATGDIVNFIDDDAEYVPDALNIIQKAFLTSNADVVYAKIIDKQNGKTLISFPKRDVIVNKRNMRNATIECSMFIKQSVFVKVKGYDEVFGVGVYLGADENIDLVIRLLGNHYKIMYKSDVVFYHPTPKELHKDKVQSYFRGRGGVYSKHMFGRYSDGMIIDISIFFIKMIVHFLLDAVTLNKKHFKRDKQALLGFIEGYKYYKKLYSKDSFTI